MHVKQAKKKKNCISATAKVYCYFRIPTTYVSCIFLQLYEAISTVNSESYEELQKLEYLDWCVNENLRVFGPVLR